MITETRSNFCFSLSEISDTHGRLKRNFPALLSFQVFLKWILAVNPSLDSFYLWDRYDHFLNKFLRLQISLQLCQEGWDYN